MSHLSHHNHAYKLSVLDKIDATTTRTQAFDQACSMEDPLQRIRNFTAALARLAPTIDDGQAAAIVQELTLAIAECLDELDGSHGFFFRLHHPDRERFEREGWPEGQKGGMT